MKKLKLLHDILELGFIAAAFSVHVIISIMFLLSNNFNGLSTNKLIFALANVIIGVVLYTKRMKTKKND